MPRKQQPDPDPRVKEHYFRAMIHVEAAENELARAARLLSPINHGGAVDWRRVSAQFERVRDLWHQLGWRVRKLRRERLDDSHAAYPCGACAGIEPKGT